MLDEVQREELAAALWPMVDSLETEQADIIRAKYQDGLGWDEIAARCGLSRAQAFNRTWTSSTERVALKLAEMGERDSYTEK